MGVDSDVRRILISLRIWHPVLSAGDVISAVGRGANVAYSAGEKRESRPGSNQLATWKETYCCFDFDPIEGLSLAGAVELILQKFDSVASVLTSLRSSGGSVELYVFQDGCDPGVGRSFQIEPDVLGLMSKLGLRLAVEIPD